MSPGRIAVGRARAVRATVVLTAASASLGAVAYAATRPEGSGLGLAGSKPVRISPQQGPGAASGMGEEAPRTSFLESPPPVSAGTEAQFRFHVPPRGQRPSPAPTGSPVGAATPTRHFKCSLDEGRWIACNSPYRLTGLALDRHSFSVRALSRAGRAGPANSYSWRQIEPSPTQLEVGPKPFSIELLDQLEELYPGYPPQHVPVRVTNPNSVAIEVTSLTVAIAEGSPACPPENFSLTPSSVSPTTPLVVPAGASATLPTATISAPTIGMLNLSVNQDPCQDAAVPLAISGEAHG